MIEVKDLRNNIFYISPHQIETIECHPDTTILFASGRKLVIKDSVSEIQKKIIEYRRQINI